MERGLKQEAVQQLHPEGEAGERFRQLNQADDYAAGKADVNGSLEAVKNALEKIDVEGVRVKVVRGAVGGITESDIVLASASNAIVIGFNVRASGKTV